MERFTLVILSCIVVSTYAWSVPFYPVRAVHRGPNRFIRHVRHVRPPGPQRPQPFRTPSPVNEPTSEEQPQRQWDRPKRDHDYDHDHDYEHDRSNSRGVTGPVHTFVKTDKNANYKWGVRHHVGNKFAS